jgi:hypothetical protein
MTALQSYRTFIKTARSLTHIIFTVIQKGPIAAGVSTFHLIKICLKDVKLHLVATTATPKPAKSIKLPNSIVSVLSHPQL